MQSVPHASGIYLISCTANNKVYVGSSIDLRKRCLAHRWLLRRHQHENIKLQRAWNKYGESAFTFEVLEEVPSDQLMEREQAWIDSLRACEDKRGFNLANFPYQGMRGRQHSTETIELFKQTRAGELNANYRGKVLTCEHCKQEFRPKGRSLKQKYCSHACYANAPKSVATRHKYGNAMRGKARTTVSLEKHFKSRAEWYVFTTPEGIEVTTQGLQKFCRENNLCQPSISAVIRGKRKHCKGWTCRKLGG